MILKDICTIIQDYMDLEDGQVWLKNEKYPKPFDTTFHISVGFSNMKILGVSASSSVTTDASDVSVQTETIGTTVQGFIVVDIQGRSFDVLTRYAEIIQAFSSMEGQNLANANTFKIGRHPISINDLSGLDGPAIPYRFQLIFGVHFIESKTRTTDNYFDTFSQPEITYDSTQP